MRGLYKGRYLIAVYDKNDELVAVAESIAELIKLNVLKSKNTFYDIISRMLKGKITSKTIFLIDCLEKQDDIFAEEDELFLDYVAENMRGSCKQEAERLGVSLRTYFRHKAKKTLYKLEKRLKEKGNE